MSQWLRSRRIFGPKSDANKPNRVLRSTAILAVGPAGILPAVETGRMPILPHQAGSLCYGGRRSAASLPRHPNDLRKLRTRYWLDRQPGQTKERHPFQFRVALDLLKRDGLGQRFLRSQVHGAPIPFGCCRI
jgi:hypothetical protein